MEYRILEWWKKFRLNFDEIKLMYSLAVIVFVCALGLLSWFTYQYFFNISHLSSLISTTDNDENVGQIKQCNFHRALDGVCVESAEKMNPTLIAVMIENHTDARPQSGLSKASIVYDAPVEANYTRFMAIYPADAAVEQIGPVRSARPYYLDWVLEYGEPMYMHCGGSPDALNKIKEYGIFDVNEFYFGKNFWRSPSRLAPHNVYTSSELWDKAVVDYNDYGSLITGHDEWWIFDTLAPARNATHNVAGGPEHLSTSAQANDIVVFFLSPNYDVEWKYDSSTEKYERWQAGAEHCEADGTLITADTVIVQHVKTKVLDEIGRISMETIGSGVAEVYYDGVEITGTWKKIDRTSRTRFYNELGEEIKLKAGKIWVEVINVH
ncbi:DUF3048 domain-containing protein [Candidatus Peregrinibacteria bacterium]|nr:DUF3048 domain-containing protein [Candidatus Peregrinibacteria bacterium]